MLYKTSVRIVAAFHTSCCCKKVTATRKLHVDRTMFYFRRVQFICMLTKSKYRFLRMYNKIIPSFLFGLHLSIVFFCMFVVSLNRSFMPTSSICYWNNEPAGNKSAARTQGEVFPSSNQEIAKLITTVHFNWYLGEELWESLLLPNVNNNGDHETEVNILRCIASDVRSTSEVWIRCPCHVNM